MKAILTAFLMVLVMMTNAQTVKTIHGKVTEQTTGNPLAGVQVTSSESKPILTDSIGNYSILAKEGAELSFTYIGYNRVVIRVAKSAEINVILEPQQYQLDEVTVVAYSPVSKQVVTGSAAQLNGSVGGMLVASTHNKNSLMIRGAASIPQNTESYKSIVDNKFMNPLQEPLSTFAADVDVASYNNIKRFIKSGQVPPVDAVRIEEMINYFQYDLAAPMNGDPVSIKTELSESPWNPQHQLMRVSLKAKDIPKEKLPASNFVFLIDVSGSMHAANKLPLVQSSLKLLIDQLRKEDKVAIVTYAGQATVALESTSGDQKMKIREVIDGLRAGGGTAGGDGLKMAYAIAKKNFISKGNNRIVMATDGDFNVGSSRDEDMETLITKERQSNMNISVLGYGMGNYKDSKLETIANKGRGNYAYINDISEARKAMISEFGATMFTVAKDVKIQVEFNPKYVQYYRLVGYENRLLAAEDFNNDSKIGGDMGVGHVVTAIYDIVPVGVKSNIVGSVDPLKYQKNEKRAVNNSSSELATVKFRYKDPHGEKSKLQEQTVLAKAGKLEQMSSDFQFITAVAELGMLLRNSEFKQESNFDSLIRRAKDNKGKDDEGYRAEFIRLTEDAKVLVKSNELSAN